MTIAVAHVCSDVLVIARLGEHQLTGHTALGDFSHQRVRHVTDHLGECFLVFEVEVTRNHRHTSNRRLIARIEAISFVDDLVHGFVIVIVPDSRSHHRHRDGTSGLTGVALDGHVDGVFLRGSTFQNHDVSQNTQTRIFSVDGGQNDSRRVHLVRFTINRQNTELHHLVALFHDLDVSFGLLHQFGDHVASGATQQAVGVIQIEDIRDTVETGGLLCSLSCGTSLELRIVVALHLICHTFQLVLHRFAAVVLLDCHFRLLFLES